jgi:hypothetical protein
MKLGWWLDKGAEERLAQIARPKGNCGALFERSVCEILGGGCAVEFVPFFDYFLGRHTVPEFCQVGGNDEAAFGAAVALENAAPNVVFGEFGFDQCGFVKFR